MKYIGIDLSWKPKNETGICIVDDLTNLKLWRSDCFTNNDLLKIIEEEIRKDDIVIAIDAPLKVENENGIRTCERELMKCQIHGKYIQIFSSNRVNLLKSYDEIRGEKLKEQILAIKSENSIEIIETYPGATILLDTKEKVKYKRLNKNKTKGKLSFLIQLLLKINWFQKFEPQLESKINQINQSDIKKKELKNIEDKIDAMICCYCSWKFKNQAKSIKIFGVDAELVI